MDSKEVLRVRLLIEKEATSRREGAAYGGEMSDRGAGQLLQEFQIWQDGLNGRVPESWTKLRTWVESDPEHAEYLRLKKKFEL